jgi:RHS repeat-associated protein
MKSATDSYNNTSTYSYDVDGHRVKRKVGSVETWQVYDIGGELIAEYAANSPQKECGYRNGQLLIATTCGSGYGDPPTLHDNPLVVGETTVQARHITELRTAINTLRTREGMAAYSWQTSATTSDWITAAPIAEMRTALDQVLGSPPSGYSAGLAQGQPIKAVHVQELRDRLMTAWSIDIRWLVTDQLGTPRMIFDAGGSLATTSRHDYLPFGQELFAGIGGRTQAQGYSLGDGARQKFTQKERDIETGLDYFLARYYSSTQGRFTSPDEFAGGPDELFEFEESAATNPTFYADIADPQSLNKYSYSYNNPLAFVDPDGHQGKVTCKNLTLPTDGAANRVLGVVSEVRRVSNNIILGPIGSKASDLAVEALDKGVHAFNQATYGPLGNCVNAILDNPTVQVAGLAAEMAAMMVFIWATRTLTLMADEVMTAASVVKGMAVLISERRR